jgi:hypothetical protein
MEERIDAEIQGFRDANRKRRDPDRSAAWRRHWRWAAKEAAREARAKGGPAASPPLPTPASLPSLDDLDDRTRAFHEALRTRVGPEIYGSWFTSVVVKELAGDKLTVTAATRFIGDWIGEHFQTQMLQAARAAFETIVTAVIVIAPDPVAATGPARAGATIH